MLLGLFAFEVGEEAEGEVLLHFGEVIDKNVNLGCVFMFFEGLFEQKVLTLDKVLTIISIRPRFIVGFKIFKQFGGLCQSILFEQNGELVKLEHKLLGFGGFGLFL